MSDSAEKQTAETEEPEIEEAEIAGPESEAYGVVLEIVGNRRVLHPGRDQWYDVARALLADGFCLGVDLTAVDYLTYRGRRPLPERVQGERFEVVACVANLDTNERYWAKVQLGQDDPTVASLSSLYPGFDFLEREVYDMFGIVFPGHPDLSRILMPEDWQGHPLRKDYAIGAIPVQFKGAPGPR